jgi:hypothetical protein
MLLKKGYTFAYFDGLNRFYVHEKHRDLLAAFSSPPNIFDGFLLSGTASQPFYRLLADKSEQHEMKAQQAAARAQQAEVKAQQAEVKAQQAEAEAQQALLLLDAIYASKSWQITAPLRKLMNLLWQLKRL